MNLFNRTNPNANAVPAGTPKVSVIVPVYNVEQYLRECLDSICGQTLRDIEIICVDDGSTDRSREILEEYRSHDERIKIIVQQNQGCAASRNAATEIATGTFIGFADADDTIEPQMFEILYNKAIETNAEIVECSGTVFNAGGVDEKFYLGQKRALENLGAMKLCKITPESFLRGKFHVVLWNKIFRLDFLREHNLRHVPELKKGGDSVFIRCALPHCKRYVRVPDKLYNYTIGRKNSLQTMMNPARDWELWLRGTREIIEHWNKNDWLESAGTLLFWRLYNLAKWRINSSLGGNASDDEMFKFLKDFLEISPKLTTTGICADLSKIPFPTDDCKKIREFLIRKILPTNPKIAVSVIIPIYNTEKYLRECLDSVCGQTLRELEIICVNDGSTDRSREILEEYRSRDERIKIINQENAGQSAARNRGLKIATGKFVYFLDSDDKIVPEALEKLAKIAEQDSLEIIFFDADSFYETPELENAFPQFKTRYHSPCDFPEIYSGDELLVFSQKNNVYNRVNPQMQFFEHEFLLKNLISFHEGVFHEDDIFTITSLANAQRVRRLRERFCLRRIRENSTMTQAKTIRHFKGYFFCALEIQGILKLKKTASQNVFEAYKNLQKSYLKLSENIISNLSTSDQIIACEIKESAVNLREKFGIAPKRKIFHLPAILVRFLALFIFNKQARKRFRERHMDLDPRTRKKSRSRKN